MKIRITRNTVVSGKWAKAGEVIDASPADAALLIRLGKAVTYQQVERAVADPDEQAVAPPQRAKRTRRKKRG